MPAADGYQSNGNIVMRLIGVPGQPDSFYDGAWVGRYDPDWRGGLGRVWPTRILSRALRFPDKATAWAFYTQVSRVKPRREDGKPNCPLRAFSVVIERAE